LEVVKSVVSSTAGYSGERYGKNWEFTQGEYISFAQSLDEEFWSRLQKKEGIDELLDILTSPMGNHTTSIADAIFYYGTSMYRIPFRRDGGLSRVNELLHVYQNLTSKDQKKFMFRHLPSEDQSDVRKDCLRIVTLFYVSRILAPSCLDQENYWTKAHLYPIEVAGAVVAAIGNFSYELKKPKVEKGKISLPIDTATWMSEYYFFVEIFTTIQRSLRMRFRDLQSTRLGQVLHSELSVLLTRGAKAGSDTKKIVINPEDVDVFVDKLNEESQKIARICPYPAYEFNAIDTENRFKTDDEQVNQPDRLGKCTVPIGARMELQFKPNVDWDVFRPLYVKIQKMKTETGSSTIDVLMPGLDYVLKNNASSLAMKLRDRARMTLDTVGKFYGIEQAQEDVQ
jgi:hypothetical protein